MPKSSDPIVQCLEYASDARSFELLCSDILAGTVYPGIEPIGGTGDGGRDAIYHDYANDITTVCAFSLRQEWKQKLLEDCRRVKSLNHKCDRFLFATSMQPTPDQRDQAVKTVREQFGWPLELYSRERLASAIRGNLEHLLELYPAIFRESNFRLAGGRQLDTSRRDILLVDHVDCDQGFAHWIARCLRLFGYDVWCRGIDATSGEAADTTIRELLDSRTRHHLPVFSKESAKCPEFRGRVEQSAGTDRRLLPLRMENVNLTDFSPRVCKLDPVPFEDHRAIGIRTLLAKLQEWNAPKDHEVARQRLDGLRLPGPKDFIQNEQELLASNVFPITTVPRLIHEWRIVGKLNSVRIQSARQLWPFVKSGNNMFSFIQPSDAFQGAVILKKIKATEWQKSAPGYYDGKDARDILTELLRRTLEFAFFRAGLLWCPERELIYFSPKKFSGKRVSVKLPSGASTTRAVCGEKHLWRPNQKGEDYNWQLAPSCRCFGGFQNSWEFRTRVFIRVTYRDDRPIESNRIITFRRHAASGWHQDKFRDLNLLFMQHAAAGESEIVVGEGAQRVVVSTQPRTFVCPIGIDEEALPKGANKFAKLKERTDNELNESEAHE